ncbi:FAD-dependent oxidoreductase [Opitutales bacterium]|jgi:protoporphyrinogen oxidase|nr:FAD-dependent oxidoreductase [Opitutales bacterium]
MKPKLKEIGGKSSPVLIVGAGMGGLACAVTLHRANIPFLLFDRDNEVGGRVRTDELDGYRLDRGFQVLLTAYPEAQRFLDYEKLELQACYPGSKVWFENRFHRVADPFRHPIDGIKSLLTPIGSLGDKLRVGMMRMGLLSSKSIPDNCTTRDVLNKMGFSDSMTDRFWKPFMRGVFLENELSTTIRKFEETFRFFSKGETVLPKNGIGEIPRQLAGQLPRNNILLETEISKVDTNSVESSDGRTWKGRAVVLATEDYYANQLLGLGQEHAEWNSVDCLYFSLSVNDLPSDEPILYLDGTGNGPINNLTFVNTLCDCAPVGQALASVSVIGKKKLDMEEIANQAKRQLTEWFGKKAEGWKYVKGYRIQQAVPSCTNPPSPKPALTEVYRCGDYFGLPSIDSAMKSGRLTAEHIIQDQKS